MHASLPLNEMSLREKIETMEILWEDISRLPDTFESPPWHKEVLDERRQRVAEGLATFTDWEAAKRHLRDQAS